MQTKKPRKKARNFKSLVREIILRNFFISVSYNFKGNIYTDVLGWNEIANAENLTISKITIQNRAGKTVKTYFAESASKIINAISCYNERNP